VRGCPFSSRKVFCRTALKSWSTTDTSGTGEDNVGAGIDELEFQQVFDLHAVELCRPVPIPSGHGLDNREAGVMDAALDAAVMAQGDFTGDKFLKVLEVTVAV